MLPIRANYGPAIVTTATCTSKDTYLQYAHDFYLPP